MRKITAVQKAMYQAAVEKYQPSSRELRTFFNHIVKKYAPKDGDLNIEVLRNKKMNFSKFAYPFTTACIIDNVSMDRDKLERISAPRNQSFEYPNDKARRVAMNELCDEYDAWFYKRIAKGKGEYSYA